MGKKENMAQCPFSLVAMRWTLPFRKPFYLVYFTYINDIGSFLCQNLILKLKL